MKEEMKKMKGMSRGTDRKRRDVNERIEMKVRR